MTDPGGEAPAAYLGRRVRAWGAQSREQRLLVGVPWALAGAVLLVLAPPLRGRRRCDVGRIAGVWAAAVPPALLLAALLAPEAVGLEWVVYGLALPLSLFPALLACRFPPRAVLAGVSGVTALLLVADGFLGSPLLGRSPFSYSPVEAARFYGIGNEAAGVLLGASLVAAAAAGGVWIAAAAGVIVTLALGLPNLGADFGGLVAAAGGFTVLAVALRQRPIRRRQVVALSAGVGLLVGGVVFWDAARGAGARTHVGQVVAATRDGGPRALLETAARKAAVGVRLLATSPWAVLLLAETVTAFRLVRRRDRRLPSADSAGGRGVVAAAGIALLVNDSGVVAASTCLLYGVGLLGASGADDGGRPGPPAVAPTSEPGAQG